MYSKGDPILHPQHGAGTITNIQSYEVNGVKQRYLCIELTSDWGTLMIPVDEATEAGLDSPAFDLKTITAVLSESPHDLADDYRERQNAIVAKINSGDPELVAEALRDLAWREQDDKLTQKERQMKDKARAFLASMLALEPDLEDIETAAEYLNRAVKQAILAHTVRGDNGADPEDENLQNQSAISHPFAGIKSFLNADSR